MVGHLLSCQVIEHLADLKERAEQNLTKKSKKVKERKKERKKGKDNSDHYVSFEHWLNHHTQCTLHVFAAFGELVSVGTLTVSGMDKHQVANRPSWTWYEYFLLNLKLTIAVF